MPLKTRPQMRDALNTIAADPAMNDGVLAATALGAWKRTPARLVGAAHNALALRHLDKTLDEMWKEDREKLFTLDCIESDEVVVGGGAHAAIYCAIRAEYGFPQPLVIEERSRVGGAFAWSERPAFFLNSRNRPGPLDIPGRRGGSLNALPGAIVQPADLSGAEYQTNMDIALPVRATLAMSAKVMPGSEVSYIDLNQSMIDCPQRRFALSLKDGGIVYTDRVILATGLRPTYDTSTERILSIDQFLRMMDEPYAMHGVNRIAVLGAGDSGKIAVESIVGQGPDMMSTMSTGIPDRIDWYGFEETYATFARWTECNRSRYHGLGRAIKFPDDEDSNGAVRLLNERARTLQSGFDCAYVDERPYDLVVDCRGVTANTPPMNAYDSRSFARDESRTLGTGYIINNSEESDKELGVIAVGPCARIPIIGRERDASTALARIPENSTSLFRYAPRTAQLAAMLDKPTGSGREKPKGYKKPGKSQSGFFLNGVPFPKFNSPNALRYDGQIVPPLRELTLDNLDALRTPIGSTKDFKRYIGQRIELLETGDYSPPLGTIIGAQESGNILQVRRDDGTRGSGPNGAYLVYVKDSRVGDYDETLAYDRFGIPLIRGAAVSYSDFEYGIVMGAWGTADETVSLGSGDTMLNVAWLCRSKETGTTAGAGNEAFFRYQGRSLTLRKPSQQIPAVADYYENRT